MSEEKNLQQYELTFILNEKATQSEGEAKTEQLKKLIVSHGGSVTTEELWGRRELAYPIKKNRSGFYVTLFFDYPLSEVKALNQELNFDEEVIRFLITKAYTTAQPGTLSPVAEEAAAEAARPGRERGEEKGSAEEMLRRSSGSKPTEKEGAIEEVDDSMPEEERLKQLDETLEEMLKEDQ